MAESIPGGAIQDAAGQWRDATGKPLDKEQIRAVEALHRQRSSERAAADAALLAREAQANPIASALAAAFRPQPAPALESPAPLQAKAAKE